MTVFICTTEGSGVDRYSQELARLLPVNVVHTSRYGLGLRAFHLVRTLRRVHEPVHFTNQHLGRFALFCGLPFVMTVHDLERLSFSFADHGLLEKAGLKLDSLAVRRAAHIIAVSENTKRDLIKHQGIPEGKVTVVYNGVNHGIFKPNGGAHLGFPYILYVGSERPRKNLGRLLAAFAEIKRSSGFPDLKLVKVGNAGRYESFRRDTLLTVKKLGLEGEVVFAGRLTDRELAAYYSSAVALIYPSTYEGFGLPVIEAMACGCPVLTSNVSALPEVAGEAALLVDPQDVGQLYQGMVSILADASLRRRMTADGRQHSLRFSWQAAAEATTAIYQRVEASQRPGAGRAC
ncbi:MAG: glycosyltransferase family 4 protein [Chloroflexi bacterium]|nr:glycosyltransferase family 4 protein [Chloroflexota bacterium]